MSDKADDSSSVLSDQFLLHNSAPSSPNSKEVRFSSDIPLQAHGIVLATQKKIGPLGRKRLRSGYGSSIRRNPSHLPNQLEPTQEEPQGKMVTNAKGAERMKMKRLGLGLSRRVKGRNTESNNNASKAATSPRKSITAMLSRKLTGTTYERAGPRYEDRLDESGLSAMHHAAQSNQASRIEELVQRHADVNVKSFVDNATPLHLAARYNCPDAADILLQCGADVTDALTNGQTPLHVCCRRGYLKVAKILIFNGRADVNSRDKDKTTPLHQAAIKGDVKLCIFLVENGAQIRAKDINQFTPLMQASSSGYKECVQYITTYAYQMGIPFDEFLSDKDNEGNTALHLAVGNRHTDVARALIERGAPVNCKKTSNGYTPLHQAAIIGEVTLAQMLIDKGAETEVFDREQMTPLHRAAIYNRVDTILLLIRQGLYLETQDEDNFTPLLCAAWKDQSDAGRSLLRYGADIKAIDKEMKTCLHWAAELQHVRFVKMLFEHGHSGEDIIDCKDRVEQTALHYSSEVGNVEIVNILISNGASVIVKDGEEKTPLHIACQFGNLECVEALLQANPVPLNDDDIDDMTPLLLASQNGHHRVVKFLIKMGADLTSRNDDRCSALSLAAQDNEMDVLNILIENNCDVNAVDKDGNTAIHHCAQLGHEAPTILLLNSGADLRLQNSYGKFPLDIAIEHRQESVAKAMLSCKSWQVAMNNCDASGYTPMRRLIAQLPEAALLVMDQCVTVSHDDISHPNLKVTYDYSYIDPGPDDISFDKNKGRYFALETMVEFNRERLLAHQLSQTSLSKKWRSFARYFNYLDFLIYLLFVIIVSMYLKMNIAIYNDADRDEDGCPYINATYYNLSYYVDDDTIWFYGDIPGITWSDRVLLYAEVGHEDTAHIILFSYGAIGIQAFILVFIFMRGIGEIIEFMRYRLEYLKSSENYLQWSMFIPTFMFVFPPVVAPCDWHWVWGVVAVFTTWMNFIFVLHRFDFFGLYVTMFFTTLKSLLKAMSVYIFFIIGFALAFFVCFQSTNDSFRSEWASIVTTFVMTLGEINKGDLLDDPDKSLQPFDQVANGLMVIFLFLMPMVLVNLTIGISVGDIEQILDSSYYKRFSLQVHIILQIEKRFPRFIQRKCWFQKATFWPNKKKTLSIQKLESFFGNSNTKFLRRSKEETTREFSVKDVMQEVQKNDKTIRMLSRIIQQQGALLQRVAEKHDIKVEQDDVFGLTSSGKGSK